MVSIRAFQSAVVVWNNNDWLQIDVIISGARKRFAGSILKWE
jgi:hypothetical protein